MVVNPFAKRKATVQREPLQDCGEALKEKEEGKRQRRSAAKDTPRRTSTRRGAARSKRVKEVDQPSPAAKEKGIPVLKDNNREKGDSKVTGKPENQGSQAIRQQDEEAPETGGGAVPETTDTKLAQGITRSYPLGSLGQLNVLSGGEGWYRTLPS